MWKNNYFLIAVITSLATVFARIILCGGFHLNFHIDLLGIISNMDWVDVFYTVVAFIHFSVLIAILLAFRKR